jgi:hypothetical protein
VNDTVVTWNREAEERTSPLTKNDRFSAVLVVLVTLMALGLGLILRQRTSNLTWHFVSREAGIEVSYPAGWLTDEGGNYVVRIRNPKARPFKTQFMIAVVPAGGATSVRNVLDSLTLQRSSELSAYRVLGVEEIGTEGIATTQMNFAFVEADPNPFVQRLPSVVLGRDIVILDGDRAIVVTYMADDASFDESLPDFQRFLGSLQY